MKRNFKLTKSKRKDFGKLFRKNSNYENQLLLKVVNIFNKELGTKIRNAKDFEEVEKIVSKTSMSSLDKFSRILGVRLLKSNKDNFEHILNAMMQGITKNASARRSEELFKKAVNSLTKEKKIYQPFLKKFEENISKIKDFPKDAADALKKAYMKGEGFRGQEIEQILTEKMKNRARLIIRTESSKLNSALTETRSKALGIQGYVWSTSDDERVRPSHKLVNGVFFGWKDIPNIDTMKGHCGEFPNCRCVSLPVFEIDDLEFPVKVANSLVIESKYDKTTKTSKAKIISGTITSMNKEKFITYYNNKLLK